MKPASIVFPDEMLGQHVGILGKTGGGKTITAKLAVEQVVSRGMHVCVLDPIKSDWWGLTLAADGKHPGLPFQILGGPYGHIPLHAGAGKVIGQLVGTGSLPLSIIDMAKFDKPGDVPNFFVDFAQALFQAKTRDNGVLYIVLEEAHVFCPKERALKEENMAIFSMKKIASASRSKGLRIIACTQRTQALHNAVLGSCDTIVVHRLTLPADKKPAVDWMHGHLLPEQIKVVEAGLGKLKTGEGWQCASESLARREFPMIRTYDNSATPTGELSDDAPKPPPVDQDKLRSLIGEAVKEAEANDPKLLKKEIADLRKQLAAKPAAVPVSVPDPEIVKERNVLAERCNKLIETVKERDSRIERIRLAVLQQTTISAVPVLDRVPMRPMTNGHARATAPRELRQTIVRPERQNRDSEVESIPIGERKTLAALIQYPDGLRREQLTVLTGYKRSSRDAYIYRLRDRGYVADAGERITATDAGKEALPGAEPLPTGDALRDYWLARLPEGERVVLQMLIDQYPAEVEKAEIDTHTGYMRSSRDAYLNRLGAKQLVTTGRGTAKASDELFN